MKRTQERWNNPHPDWSDRYGVSGLREFDGEDLSKQRQKYFQNEQKKWLDQQIREKNSQKQREKFEDNLYSQQTLEILRMRGMLEDEFAQKKTELTVSQKDLNRDLAREKKDREEQELKDKLAFEQNELRVLQQRSVRQPYP